MGVLRGLKWLYFGIFRVLKRHLIGWKRWYSHFMLKWLNNRKYSPNPNICTIYELNKSSYYKLNKIFHSQTMYDSTKKLLTTFYPIFWCSSNLYVKDWSFFETTSKIDIASIKNEDNLKNKDDLKKEDDSKVILPKDGRYPEGVCNLYGRYLKNEK